jgi:hypothetical protein
MKMYVLTHVLHVIAYHEYYFQLFFCESDATPTHNKHTMNSQLKSCGMSQIHLTKCWLVVGQNPFI